MALAHSNFHELSHQLRFLLFEVGIGLPQRAIEHFISFAHRQCLQRLQQAVIKEGLVVEPIVSHHVHDFLDQLQAKLKTNQPASAFFHWQRLRDNLDESIANEAMAQAYHQRWQAELKRQAKDYTSFWMWLGAEHHRQDAVQLLEQWGCLGHPYHPHFRAKMGFSRREVLQYSPEFNAQISLHWCALRKQQIQLTTNQINYSEFLANQFPKEYNLWQEKLRFKQVDIADYYPIPMHPWQWRNQIQNTFSSLIDKKALILIPHHQLVKPSMSFRTMMPLRDNACHIEFASTARTDPTLLSTSTTDNFSFSVWLSQLLHQNQHYQQSLFLAEELAGLSIQKEPFSTTQDKQFVLTLRKNPDNFLRPWQKMVPLAALFAQSPLSNLPLLIEIINSSGLNPIDYFSLYCRQVLTGQLHLLFHYGIALESHQQNTLVIFTDNKPEALVMREQTNALVCINPCYQHVVKPVFHPDSAITTDNLAVLCQQFIEGNLQNNLAYWLGLLHRYFSLRTEKLWGVIYSELQTTLKTLAPTVEPGIFKQQSHRLLAEPWHYHCRLTMLLNNRSSRLPQSITNPLYEFYN
ncbi:IucA/IucC family protein [Legionella tunisiensis]|uniref:IucA/IucC family protein n=1 Tax=Legionella tunisiensis TaxID=1034944 RepID=UPI0002F48F47|nr:IucA/IucC family protein [Legionella tunisiensis]